MTLSAGGQSNTLFSLEASTNLSHWQGIGTFHDALYPYPDFSADRFTHRFYRLASLPRRANDDWKNQIVFPSEPFCSTNHNAEVGWIKFAILLDDPVRVFYEDSKKYPFHYNFATQRLAPFIGMDPAAFEEVSLHRANQKVLLGTVLYPPGVATLPVWSGSFLECGIQFDGLDPYPPGDIGRWIELVKATVYSAKPLTFYYMPTFEQSEVTRAQPENFAALGLAVSSIDRWLSVKRCYAPGWALGRLKYFPATDVVAAFGDGRLRLEDILLTDGVPANMPLLAGIITLTPSTPNSHTALLAQSYGVPFVYLPTPSDQARVQALVGHKIILRATVARETEQVKIVDIEGQLAPAFESELLALLTASPLEISPKHSYGALWASTDGLAPSDIQYFGGKAANYGWLRRSIPTNCPVAIAFSFDLWDAFLDQTLPGGRTLRKEIAQRLAPYATFPPDIGLLKTNLAAIRDLFTKTANFTPAQQQAITNALSSFNPRRNLRFRSSTNVEDTERFTGAGLYDSFSGCLMDDLDGDDAGPCQCDPASLPERGVFRALRKVYASFYNDDAFLERLKLRVDEALVGMGVLVHYSFPDAEELANGVAAPRFAYGLINTNITGELVTQLGAASVTNPDGNSIPEVVSVFGTDPSYTLRIAQRSSLLPLGGMVMDWQTDYLALFELLHRVAQDYHQYYPAKNPLVLDFEYKKDAHQGLMVKQVRLLPQSNAASPVTPFLIDEPVVCQVAQYGSVFANHRLKSLWTLRSPNLRLAPTNLVQGVYAQCSLEYLDHGILHRLDGPMTSWPNASNSLSGSVNYWTTGNGAQLQSWQMDTTLQTNVTALQPPIFTPADFARLITVTYATPQPQLYGDYLTNITSEFVRLQVRDDDVSSSIRQNREFVKTNVVTIQTSYYWPKPAEGIMAISTPLQRFIETRISGLTTQPIVLTNYYAQTYGAFAHNYMEQFLFEPRLDPGVPAATLAELQAANIQWVYVSTMATHAIAFYVIGFDQSLRPL